MAIWSRPALRAGVIAGALLTAASVLYGRPQETGEGAAIDAGSFRYVREIVAGGPGLTVVTLDAAALAHSRLADLRIVSQGARQVPFLLEHGEDPQSIELPALEPATPTRNQTGGLPAEKGGRSFYRVRFPFAGLSSVRLMLETSAAVFEREVRVVLDDPSSQGRHAPRTVAWRWLHTSPDTPASPAIFDLGEVATTSALVIVDEGDNSPLPLGRPTLLLDTYRLRFFSQQGVPLTLVYGNGSIEAPQYDLTLLRARLAGAAATEATLGPEQTRQQASDRVSSVAIFWAVLVAAVIALITLIVRLLGKAPASS